MATGATQAATRTRRGSSEAGRSRPAWQKALLHLLLVVFGLVFLIPLFWLVGSSLKTDDQIKAFPPEWIPAVPWYSAESPYIRLNAYGRIRRPTACPQPLWGALQRPVAELLAAQTAELRVGDHELTAAEREAVVRGLWHELLDGLPPEAYEGGLASALAEVQAAVALAKEKAWRKLYHQLAVGAVTVQYTTATGEAASATAQRPAWEGHLRTETEQGELGGEQCALVRYRDPGRGGAEASAGGRESVVHASLPWSTEVRDLQSVTLRMHGDGSWRRAGVLVRTPGGLWLSAFSVVIGGRDWEDVAFICKERGQIAWGTHRLRQVGPGHGGSSQLQLAVSILPTTFWGALWQKFAANYRGGMTFIPFWRYLFNTGLICALTVLGTLLSCSLVAYGLARLDWRGRNVLFYVLLGTMMLPFQVTMVPMFVLFARLGWVDTFLPLIVPHFFGSAFYVFLMRQFFLTIPRELTDAARVDGCTEWQIYRRIILPLSKPVLATVGLFSFMAAWNDYMGPLIYLADASKYTLSLGLATFSSQYGSYPGMLMAVTTVMALPIIVLFFFTQRTFIQGMTLTGIKG